MLKSAKLWSVWICSLAVLSFGVAPFATSSDEMPGDDDLVLLESVEKEVHQIRMDLIHTPQSLENGWVKMSQCHRNMAPTGRSSVDFKPERIRALKLLSFKEIGRAWIGEGGISVEMEEVSRGNEICLEGEVRSVYLDGDTYHQKSGPYYLRFLDGFFPLKLDLTVDSSQSGVRVSAVHPSSVPYMVDQYRLRIDLLFEGRLNLDFTLQQL